MNNSQLFTEAHKLAKTYEGDYVARFVLALQVVKELLKAAKLSFAYHGGMSVSDRVSLLLEKELKKERLMTKDEKAQAAIKKGRWNRKVYGAAGKRHIFVSNTKYFVSDDFGKMTYHEAYDKYGFDFAEEGNY